MPISGDGEQSAPALLSRQGNTLSAIRHLSGAREVIPQCHVPLKWRSAHNNNDYYNCKSAQ